MEQIKSFFDSFKEFIWDVIGYLLPGTYLIILLQYCISKDFLIEFNLSKQAADFYPYFFLTIAYILGHIVYGFGWFKEGILGKLSYTKKIEKKVSGKKAYLLAKKLITKNLTEKELNEDFETATVRDIRSIIMSYNPENDQKVYSFTFRSELANQTGNISLVIGTLGFFVCILNYFGIKLQLFQCDTTHVWIYICLVVSYLFLRQTRNRFYAISMGLPFSIYTASEIKR